MVTSKVCIFDVNGVLIDSNLANARAMAQAFTDYPVLQHRIAELYLKLTGIDRGSKIRIIQEQMIGRSFNEKEFEQLWEKVKNLTHLSMLKASLLKGCKEVLTELGKLKIIRVALSNTPLVELQHILVAHHLESLLEIIRGGGDWPKSESLVRLVSEFQFDPGKCVFIGDGKGDWRQQDMLECPLLPLIPAPGNSTVRMALTDHTNILLIGGKMYWG